MVHEASGSHMDFEKKNFRYVNKAFEAFIDEISAGSRQYLRSVGLDNPAAKPANLAVDYPEITSDFRLPHQFDIVKQHMHSSILRISGPVIMWLHYDVGNVHLPGHRKCC